MTTAAMLHLAVQSMCFVKCCCVLCASHSAWQRRAQALMMHDAAPRHHCRLNNFGEFFTSSVGAIGHMILDGAIDRNITLVPDLDGFELQPYMKFFLEPFTIHPVLSAPQVPSQHQYASLLKPGCQRSGRIDVSLSQGATRSWGLK